MTMSLSPHAYDRAAALAEAGRHEEALAAIREHLAQVPADGPALNDAGTLLYALGRLGEAAVHLEAAHDHLDGDRGQALWNLAEVYLAARRPDRTLNLFDDLADTGMLSPELANRTASMMLEMDRRGGAIEALIQAYRHMPDQNILLPIIEQIRTARPKVAFFCDTGDTKFMTDIYAFSNARFQTRFYTGTTDDEMFAMLQWCDIAWFEWCTPQVITASQLPKVCRSICRLHRFEAFRDEPPAVQWENIDALVTIGNRFVLSYLCRQIPDLQQRTQVVVIPTAVDLDRFSFVKRTRGKNLAHLGYINMRKNPSLLLQCFHRLHERDPEYRLYFGGKIQDPMLLQYMQNMIIEMNLTDSVFIQGWQDDITAWLEDKHYLISASVGEGLPAGILEGMARGMKPIIHTWPGARDFFPPECLFRTVDEFCDRIIDGPYEPEVYREFVETRHPLKQHLKRTNELFLAFERNPWPPKDDALDPADATPKASAEEPDEDDDAVFYDQRWGHTSIREGKYERLRRKRIVEAIDEIGRVDLRLLDLGCGRGILEPFLAPFGQVTAIDWSEEGVRAAEFLCPEATVVCGNFLETVLPHQRFDVIVSQEVIEHLADDDQARYLAIAHDVLVPGGRMILTTPNRPVMEALNQEYLAQKGRPWTDQPVENWLDADRLAALTSSAGFHVERCEAFIDRGTHRGLHTFLVACRNGTD